MNIRIDRDWEAGTVKISQPAAISKLAAKFHLDDIKTTGAPLIPMRPDLHLQKAVGDKIINRDVFDYVSVVGSLLYLSLTCRPDISVATGSVWSLSAFSLGIFRPFLGLFHGFLSSMMSIFARLLLWWKRWSIYLRGKINNQQGT